MKKGIIGVISTLWATCSFAFPCYVTIVKDSCWTNYDVQVNVLDEAKKTALTTISIPKGQSFSRNQFECEPKQELAFSATFQPAFWENEKGAHYPGKRFIFLPTAAQPNEAAWNIPLCFTADFTKVPLPPTGDGHCRCDFSQVPAIKPSQKGV